MRACFCAMQVLWAVIAKNWEFADTEVLGRIWMAMVFVVVGSPKHISGGAGAVRRMRRATRRHPHSVFGNLDSMGSPAGSLFISYARDDDEEFACRLCQDLNARGYMVWWDRAAMESRGRRFIQEIREAIAKVDRLILIAGPRAECSEYVQAEWTSAIDACKVVIPLLRLGQYSSIPRPLANLHCIDFRATRKYDEGLAELLRILESPVPPPAALNAVDALPPHFVPRPDLLECLRGRMLPRLRETSAMAPFERIEALSGMGGVGKSVVAACFARDCEIRRAFFDGVIWLRLGQDLDLRGTLERIAQFLGDFDAHSFLDLPRAKWRLTQLLEHKACLIVLDDVWEPAPVEVLLGALGARCRLLITTRDAGLARSFGVRETPVAVLDDRSASDLLAKWSGAPVHSEASLVARECGNLPFALTLCGAMNRSGVAWRDVLEALRDADLTFLERDLPNYPYPNLLQCVQASLDGLAHSDPDAVKCYMRLAVFPAAESIPSASIVGLWQHTDGMSERNARRVITLLAEKGLLRTENERSGWWISLHDIHHDYLLAKAKDLTQLHSDLLGAYWRQCEGAWHRGPNDRYFFEHLPHHLCNSGRRAELRDLLLDFEWLQAKLKAAGVADLIRDYDLFADDPDLQTVRSALVLAAHVLIRKPEELPAQLVGRMNPAASTSVQAMIEKVKRWRGGIWLRAKTPVLPGPGGALINTHEGHEGRIHCVALTPNGLMAITAGNNAVVKIWRCPEVLEVRALMGHPSQVAGVNLSPDGRHAIAVSEDGAVSIWNVQTGDRVGNYRLPIEGDKLQYAALANDLCRMVLGFKSARIEICDTRNGDRLSSLAGHAPYLRGLAITGNGRVLISAADDWSLKVWDLGQSREIREVRLDTDQSVITALALSDDGFAAVTLAESGLLLVSNTQTGAQLHSFRAPCSLNRPVAVSADARHTLSGSPFGSIRFWRLTGLRSVPARAGHSRGILSVAAASGESLVVTGAADGMLKVWDVRRGVEIAAMKASGHFVRAVAISGDGRRAVSASNESVQIWDWEKGVETGPSRPSVSDSWVHSLAISQDGRRMLLGTLCLEFWNADTLLRLRNIPYDDWVWAVAISPDGRWALSGSDDRLIKVWDLIEGRVIRTLEGHADWVHSISMTADGTRAASYSADGVVKLWDVSKGVALNSIMVRSEGEDTRNLDPSEPEHRAKIVFRVAQSIAIAAKLFDLLVSPLDHNGGGNFVSLSDDGSTAFSVSGGRTITMWDLSKGLPIASFTGEEALFACAASGDGSAVVAGDSTGRVYFFDVIRPALGPAAQATEVGRVGGIL
jgi:WD40 repeat protein